MELHRILFNNKCGYIFDRHNHLDDSQIHFAEYNKRFSNNCILYYFNYTKLLKINSRTMGIENKSVIAKGMGGRSVWT